MKPSINFPDNFPILKTERLVLSKFEPSDVENFFNLRSDKEFMKYLDLYPMKKMSEARDRIHSIIHAFNVGEGISWKISLSGSSDLIGYIGFWKVDYRHYRGDIGFGIDLDYQQQGYMSEAISKAVEYGFLKLGLHSIKADVNPNNQGSIQLLLNTGFQKEALLRENYFFNGDFLDSEYYGMIKSDLK